LSSVPENAMKMLVGLMLVSFGTFWVGEGVRVHWPGSDLAIPVLVAAYGLAVWGLVHALQRGMPRRPLAGAGRLGVGGPDSRTPSGGTPGERTPSGGTPGEHTPSVSDRTPPSHAPAENPVEQIPADLSRSGGGVPADPTSANRPGSRS